MNWSLKLGHWSWKRLDYANLKVHKWKYKKSNSMSKIFDILLQVLKILNLLSSFTFCNVTFDFFFMNHSQLCTYSDFLWIKRDEIISILEPLYSAWHFPVESELQSGKRNWKPTLLISFLLFLNDFFKLLFSKEWYSCSAILFQKYWKMTFLDPQSNDKLSG